MNIEPDVEVFFEFNGVRRTPVKNGYRPGHLIKEDYVTTGVHNYYSTNIVEPYGVAIGTITFLTPEFYPHCLWIGKKIDIMEGKRIVGYATIIKIFNSILEKQI